MFLGKNYYTLPIVFLKVSEVPESSECKVSSHVEH